MFGRRKDESGLKPPPIAATKGAVEVLRVWAQPGGVQQYSMQVTWEDPRAWGLMIADIVRHAALAYAQEGHDPIEVASQIKAMFDAEWSAPTSDAERVDQSDESEDDPCS